MDSLIIDIKKEIEDEVEVPVIWSPEDINGEDPLADVKTEFLIMENNLKPEDTKQECCKVVIKEEVCFELIEEQDCIDGIEEESEAINIIKKEKGCLHEKHHQSFTSHILKEENISVNQIKKEELNTVDVNKDEEFIKEEEEFDYIWPEDVLKETDPLACPEIKCVVGVVYDLVPKVKTETPSSAVERELGVLCLKEGEFKNIKEDETVESDSCSKNELLGFKVHDARNKQRDEETPQNLSTLDNLKQHKRLHTSERLPHESNVCEYAASTSSHTRERPFKCNVCEYASSRSSCLKVHMAKHTGERPYKCTVCSLAFLQSSDLKIHMRSHTGERPYKCTLCEFASSRSSHLKVHMAKHTGERPYKCTLCEFASSTSYHLKRHMAKHTGERPYKCTVCSFAFLQSSDLKIHMRSHTGERPYKCTLCEFASSRSFHLKVHMAKHTGERPYKCTLCKYASSRSSNLKRHMAKHMGE